MVIDEKDFIAEFCRELEIDPSSIEMQSKLEGIHQWDSLGMVRFLLLCDEKYGMQLPAVVASRATTIADLKHKVECAAADS